MRNVVNTVKSWTNVKGLLAATFITALLFELLHYRLEASIEWYSWLTPFIFFVPGVFTTSFASRRGLLPVLLLVFVCVIMFVWVIA